mmetsp:Transcript_21065/g.23494  ORF Transcript_21065/g.23494 Transcript_21065/m.23494 type:complete len:184 (-) Transcript_21065:81-632(-)
MTDHQELARAFGMTIDWVDGGLFPDYQDRDGDIVTRDKLEHASQVVLSILSNEDQIMAAFVAVANERPRKKRRRNNRRKRDRDRHTQPITVTVDFARARKKVSRVRLQRVRRGRTNYNGDRIEVFGESDERTIWIREIEMNDEDLVGTLLHEAIHFIGRFNGREMSERREHRVMQLLGEDCEL